MASLSPPPGDASAAAGGLSSALYQTGKWVLGRFASLFPAPSPASFVPAAAPAPGAAAAAPSDSDGDDAAFEDALAGADAEEAQDGPAAAAYAPASPPPPLPDAAAVTTAALAPTAAATPSAPEAGVAAAATAAAQPGQPHRRFKGVWPCGGGRFAACFTPPGGGQTQLGRGFASAEEAAAAFDAATRQHGGRVVNTPATPGEIQAVPGEASSVTEARAAKGKAHHAPKAPKMEEEGGAAGAGGAAAAAAPAAHAAGEATPPPAAAAKAGYRTATHFKGVWRSRSGSFRRDRTIGERSVCGEVFATAKEAAHEWDAACRRAGIKVVNVRGRRSPPPHAAHCVNDFGVDAKFFSPVLISPLPHQFPLPGEVKAVRGEHFKKTLRAAGGAGGDSAGEEEEEDEAPPPPPKRRRRHSAAADGGGGGGGGSAAAAGHLAYSPPPAAATQQQQHVAASTPVPPAVQRRLDDKAAAAAAAAAAGAATAAAATAAAAAAAAGAPPLPLPPPPPAASPEELFVASLRLPDPARVLAAMADAAVTVDVLVATAEHKVAAGLRQDIWADVFTTLGIAKLGHQMAFHTAGAWGLSVDEILDPRESQAVARKIRG